MIRTFAFCAFVALLVGCTKYHSRAQGPFARGQDRDLPPPYGASAKPLTNQSPLVLGAPVPVASSNSDERPVVPRADARLPVEPPTELDDPNAFPPFRKRPEPKPGTLPSPFVPKESNTPKMPAPGKAVSPAQNLAELKAVLATANAAWKGISTFEGTLTKREINPQGGPISEVVLFQYRREPMAMFTRTLSEKGKGREVVYNPSKHEDKIYVMLGKDDHPLFKAGRVLPGVSPDSPLVKEKSRYSIRDTGFGKHLDRLGTAVTNIEAGKTSADALTFHGPVKRDEYPYSLTGIAHNLRAGDDPILPKGGTRTYFFDLKEKSPSYGLPVLIVAVEPSGKEVEFYLFEKIKSPANLTEAHFNPDRLGKK